MLHVEVAQDSLRALLLGFGRRIVRGGAFVQRIDHAWSMGGLEVMVFVVLVALDRPRANAQAARRAAMKKQSLPHPLGCVDTRE